MNGRTRRLLTGLLPALLLAGGWAGGLVLQPTRELGLVEPLESLSTRLGEYRMLEDRRLSEAELSVLAPDAYLLRTYTGPELPPAEVYVAFYGHQARGSSVHSPRNCLPGSGWEPLRHERAVVDTSLGGEEINRYVVEHESGAQAVVYYWYQGRGRVEASEYRVKWDLIRDAVVRRRTDEALIRVVIPLPRGMTSEALGDPPILPLVVDALRAHLPA